MKKLSRIGIILALSVIFGVAGRSTANAQNISWTDQPPIVVRSKTIESVSETPCNSALEVRQIEGELSPKLVCVTRGDKVSVGDTFYTWGGARTLVSFGLDKKMYKLNGICSELSSCLYIPNKDMLITKQYLIPNYTLKSLVIYDNFSSRLSSQIRGLSTEYFFDSSNPNYVFSDSPGSYPWPIGGWGVSDNGDWLALEYRQKGVGILNLNQLTMKKITSKFYPYGYGLDPTTELAISNDGEHIAVMGLNSGLSIYDVSKFCGEFANGMSLNNNETFNSCPESRINRNDVINNFKLAIRPRFSLDGGSLHFFASSYFGETRDVTMQAAGYVRPRLDYLALGDSFTSGEGEKDDHYYQPNTNTEYEKCHLSSRSYPYLIASYSDISPTFMKSIACSGAKTSDILGAGLYLGQGGRLGSSGLNLETSDRIFSQSNALLDFIPGRIRQQDFVSYYSPKVITVGIGGNDAGLIEKLQDCAGSGTCKWVSDPKLREQTAIEIRSLFEKLRYTYSELSDKSLDSKVIAIGYPQIIDITGVCPNYVGQLYNNLERDFIYESIHYLNQVVQAAAKSAGVGYADIENALEGHTLCGLDSSAMNAVRMGDDSGWLGNEGFHPNANGHRMIADKINGTIGNILDYSYCPGNAKICPDDRVIAPFPSLYWLPEGEHPYASLQGADFVKDGSDYRHKNLFLDSHAFKPDSIISITAMSETIELGEYGTDSDGSLNMTIELPENFEEGYHTLFLHGVSYSGEPIDLYQVFRFQKPAIPSDNSPTTGNGTVTNNTVKQTNTTDSNKEDSKAETEASTEKNFAETMNDSITAGVKGASIVKKADKIESKDSSGSSFNTNIIAVTISLILLFVMILVKSWTYLRNKSK